MRKTDVVKICAIPQVERAKLEVVFDSIHRSYMKKMTSNEKQELTVWTKIVPSVSELRQTVKTLMRALNLRSVKKDLYESTVIIQGVLQDNTDVSIWISTPYEAKKFLPILSEYFNCKMKVVRQKVKTTITSVACAKTH